MSVFSNPKPPKRAKQFPKIFFAGARPRTPTRLIHERYGLGLSAQASAPWTKPHFFLIFLITQHYFGASHHPNQHKNRLHKKENNIKFLYTFLQQTSRIYLHLVCFQKSSNNTRSEILSHVNIYDINAK